VTWVRVRLPEKVVRQIDRWVVERGFKSRSDAIRAFITLYEEWEKTRKFLKTLASRSDEARKHPEMLIPFE